MSLGDIHPAPDLSVYERSLLQDNKRLRDELILLADFIKPDWREKGLPIRADWMIEEVQRLNRSIETLIDVAARK